MKRLQQQHKNQKQIKKLLWLIQRNLVIASIFNIVFVIAFVWIISILGVIPVTWATILSAIASILGVLSNVLEFVPSHEAWKSRATSTHSKPILYVLPIVVHGQLTQSPSLVPSINTEDIHHEIINISSPTYVKAVQRHEKVVEVVFGKRTELSSSALVLTSIDGLSKSMLVALVSQGVEVAWPDFGGSRQRDNRVDSD